MLHRIKKETGLELSKDYGFITGTMHPCLVNGMTAAGNFDGYEVWKRGKNDTFVIRRISQKDHSIETIINFLKDE